MSEDYAIGNKAARRLTDANANNNKSDFTLNDSNQETIDNDDDDFVRDVRMFDEIPINTKVAELLSVEITPIEKEDSEIFTFDYRGSGGGVFRLNETTMTCDLGLRYNDAQLDDDTICDFIPRPLHTWMKSIEVQLNEVTMTNSNTENLHVSYITDFLFTNRIKNKNTANLNLSWRNEPGEENFLSLVRPTNANNVKALNKTGFKRIECFRNRDTVYVVDDLSVAFFGAGVQYLPTNQRYTIKFTKDTPRRIFTGSECKADGTAGGTNSDFHITNANDSGTPHANYTGCIINGGQNALNLSNLDKIKSVFKNFKLRLKQVTPEIQIQQEISRMLDVQGKLMNVFFQEIHIPAHVHDLSNTKFEKMNIFSGNVPYVIIITITKADYVNGDFFYPPTYFTWEKMIEIIVKVNSVPIPYKIKNSKDAYYHTKRALHLTDNEEMFIPYEFYEDGNAIIVLELNPTEDSHLKVIPLDTKKNVDVEITFTSGQTGNVYIKFMGFLNQVAKVGTLKMTYKQLAI